VNDALRALKDPIQRALLLLARRGIQLAEGAEPKASTEFLMSMLELRETLAEAERARDAASVARLARSVQQRAGRVLSQIAREFAELESEASSSAPRAEAIVVGIGELRFLHRLLAEANALEDEFG
jgi:Fe-S protein assembly co-chaperone HscB